MISAVGYVALCLLVVAGIVLSFVTAGLAASRSPSFQEKLWP